MKKLIKILIAILVLIAIAIGGIIYALQPEGGIKEDTTGNREMTKEDIIQMGLLESLEFKKDTGKFEGSVAFNSEELSNILYTVMKDHDSDDIIPNDIRISNNKIVVTVPVEIEFIRSQAEITFVPSVKNNDFIMTIENVKLGKINFSEKIISKFMEYEKNEIPYIVEGNSIIIPSETLKPMELTKVYIENNELKIYMQISLKDAMQYAYGSFIKPAA